MGKFKKTKISGHVIALALLMVFATLGIGFSSFALTTTSGYIDVNVQIGEVVNGAGEKIKLSSFFSKDSKNTSSLNYGYSDNKIEIIGERKLVIYTLLDTKYLYSKVEDDSSLYLLSTINTNTRNGVMETLEIAPTNYPHNSFEFTPVSSESTGITSFLIPVKCADKLSIYDIALMDNTFENPLMSSTTAIKVPLQFSFYFSESVLISDSVNITVDFSLEVE